MVDDLVANLAIPRNWIADKNGRLRQEGVGFSAQEWPEKILARLEAGE